MNPSAAYGSNFDAVQEGLKEWGTQDGSIFMCIKVLVDTSKPLCQGRKVYGDDGKVGWIRFKYEQLSNLCYWCGLLSHSDKDHDLWVQSRGTLTEQDQQFGGWLRVPPITAKKCSVVREEGCGAVMEDAKEQQAERNEEDPMDMSEVQVYGNSGVPQIDEEQPQVDNGDFGVSSQDSKDAGEPLRTSLKNFVGQGVSSNEQFHEKLKKIDAKLAKFDSLKSSVHSSFISKEHNSLLEQVDPHQVQETEEESEAPRSITQGWKWLLRIREASQAEPSLGQQKRRVQAILEDEDDLVPLKKCCASAKSNETAEAINQPRREQ